MLFRSTAPLQASIPFGTPPVERRTYKSPRPLLSRHHFTHQHEAGNDLRDLDPYASPFTRPIFPFLGPNFFFLLNKGLSLANNSNSSYLNFSFFHYFYYPSLMPLVGKI